MTIHRKSQEQNVTPIINSKKVVEEKVNGTYTVNGPKSIANVDSTCQPLLLENSKEDLQIETKAIHLTQRG